LLDSPQSGPRQRQVSKEASLSLKRIPRPQK
jgi:hypothetical protein